MTNWVGEIQELEKLYESFKGHLPAIVKELEQLIRTNDPNVAMLYSRRCLEVIITDLCESELKRPRKTEPLKGIIDKLNSEEIVPSHIITSMHSLNSLATYGTHPKDFDPEQVKPVLNNLAIIIRWYLKYKDFQFTSKTKNGERKYKSTEDNEFVKVTRKPNIKSLLISTSLILLIILVSVIIILNLCDRQIGDITELEKSIAVLPFKSFSDDPEKQYLADGMMDAILLHLSKIEDLRVTSRTSVEQYRKTTKTTSTIGKELGVTYLLEGSFQKYDDTARLIVQLIKTGKETHEWANQYDRKWSDIFSVQSEVSQAIANELKAIVTPVEQQLIEKKPTQDLTAYEAYLKGRFYEETFNLIELDTALHYFELAKEKDPEFALAYTGIAYVWLARQQIELVPPEEAGPKAMAALKRASELDNTLAEVHYFMGVVYQFSTWDWENAESEYKKTIEINPNYAEAYMMYASLLSVWGRNEEAFENFEHALKLDPFHPLINLMYCSALLNARQYEACISACRREIEKNQTNFIAYEPLYNALYLKGKYEESLEAMRLHYMGALPKFNHVFDQYKKLGYVGTLNLEIDTLIAQSKSKPLSPQFLIELYFFAGNKERALDCMEQAYEWHDPNLPGQIVRPTYESLCNEPRYQELLGKLNLPKCN